MAKKDVTFLNPKNDDLDVTITDQEKSTNNVGFEFIWPLADVIVHYKDQDYTVEENQVDFFTYDIAIIADKPDTMLAYLENNHPEYDPDNLELIYYDKTKNNGKWVLFDRQETSKKTKIGSAKLKKWIKDPPIGWGGDFL